MSSSSSSIQRALFYLSNSSLHSNPPCCRNFVDCFRSASNKLPGGNIGEGDRRVQSGNKKIKLEKSSRSRVVAEDAVEIAKAGVVGAVEVGLKFGEMTKQIGDGLWDAAKETADSVLDSINDNQMSKSNITHDITPPATGFDLKHDLKDH